MVMVLATVREVEPDQLLNTIKRHDIDMRYISAAMCVFTASQTPMLIAVSPTQR
jgi:hypothetical protein